MVVVFNRKKFRSIRKKRGLSQAVLAEMADTSVRYISALETGKKSNPSAMLLRQLSRALDITMEDLLISEEENE